MSRDPRRNASPVPLVKGVAGAVGHVVSRVRKASQHSVSPRLIGWSVLVGLISGAVVSFFRWFLARALGWLFNLYNLMRGGQWWLLAPVIVASVLIALALAWMIRTQPISGGSGIPDVERRLRAGDKESLDFPWLQVLWRKLVGGILGIGAGLFLGREGPSIQIGSALAVGVSELTHTTRLYRLELVAAGAAAGLAAAFNAPMAGVLFVVEEVFGRFSLRVALAAFASAVSADMVALKVFGLAPVFVLPPAATPFPHDYVWLAVLGLVLGLLAWVYERSLVGSIHLYRRLRLPDWAKPLIPLLLVIPVGLYLPQALAGGNFLVTSLGTQPAALWLLAVLLLVRLVGGQLSYGCGIPGGIFLPILSLGAVSGVFLAQLATVLGLVPAAPAYVCLAVIVGMAGLFGAVSKAPLTAIILVMEMTSFGTLLPLAVVTLIAYLVFDALGGQPIYDVLGSL